MKKLKPILLAAAALGGLALMAAGRPCWICPAGSPA